MKLNFITRVLFLLPLSAAALERTIGNIEMQMRSQIPSDMNQILVKIMTATVTFLDDAFSEYYVDHYKGKDYFEKVSLSVNSYGMELTPDGSYIARASFRTRAFFGDIKNAQPPTRDELVQTTNVLFQESNQEFLLSLTGQDDPFLQDISYAVVKVNGVVAASNSSIKPSEDSNGPNNWVYAIIAGVGAFFIVLNLILLCYCCCGKGRNELPSVRKTSTSGTSQDDDASSCRPDALSPVRSFTSQDSSIFTYNPKSTKSVTTRQTFGSVFTSEVDVEAWKKKSVVQKDVFGGNDISAITNKKDLSLIEEGSEGEEEAAMANSRHKSKRRSAGKTSTAYLSEFALSDLERGERVISRQPSRASSSGGSRHQSSSSSRQSYSTRELEMSTDVIDDLKNLSHQIDHFRSR